MKPIGSSRSRNGVFISYARGDGEAFATDLRSRLEAEKIPLWQDCVGMEGGRDWWLQITDALDQVEFMALVITPKALASPIVRKEWRYARQQGVCVYPVIGAKGLDYASLPRWMRDAHFYDLDHQWERFLNDLRTRCETPRVPFMVDDMPEDFVERPGEFDQLLDLLLTPDREEPLAITAALRGAGGFGKTALARALCHNDDVQNAFDDGILWVTLGETPGDLIPRVEGLIHSLTGERPGFTSLEAAVARFRELIEERDLLIVIDDVWNQSHLRPFLQGGKRCARLITTRNLDTLPPGALKVTVDAMQPSEARSLLGKGLEGEPDFEDAVHDLDFLSSRLGEWPLLLKLVNGFLRKSVEFEHRTIRDAIVRANKALDKKGLVYFDINRSDDRNDAVARTIEISLEWLTPDERNRYFELAVFPEDKDIPLQTVFKLWARTGGLDEFDSEDLISKFNGLSLLLNFDASRRIFQLHDVIRHYLIGMRIGELSALHADLIESHRPSTGWSDLPENEPYLWDQLAEHLVEAGLGQELVSTVKDWRYLIKKTFIRKSSPVERDLIRAEAIAPGDDAVHTLRRSFANSGHIFNHCDTRADLKSTVYVRLRHLEDLKAIIDDLGEHLDLPRIDSRFRLPDLPHPALLRTFEGHSSGVSSCAFSPDGRQVVSASDDRTLKLWDASSGDLLRTFEGHSSEVSSCAFSPDGRQIVSASDDRTLKLWDASCGDLLLTFEGHSSKVISCAFSPDGRQLVSASIDRTIKLWDVSSGDLLLTFEGHSSEVYSCAFSPDGRQVISASHDRTLKLWDASSGDLLRTFEGHSSGVWSCAFSPDGRQVVSASTDNTLKLWDASSGDLLRIFESHSDMVWSCAFSPDGRQVVSASSDHTLKLWDVSSGDLLRTFEGHSDMVWSCAFSPDGRRLISASYDRTLKLWDTSSGDLLRTFEGRSFEMRSCAFSPDGRQVVSASADSTLKLWDASSGDLLRTFEGHSSGVSSCAFSPDGRQVASASYDRTLKLWDASSGDLLRTFEGHSDWVLNCAFSPDGRHVVSASSDSTLKLWDASSGDLLLNFEGHSSGVISCVFSPDGRQVVSASSDRTLKHWDASSGDLLCTFEGHSSGVSSCAFSPDGRQLVSASIDRTLKLWDASSGDLLRTFEGHSFGVRSCAFSPDGRHVVSASSDSTLKLWDASSGECLATFHADGPMQGVAMHGEMIAAAGARGVYFLGAQASLPA